MLVADEDAEDIEREIAVASDEFRKAEGAEDDGGKEDREESVVLEIDDIDHADGEVAHKPAEDETEGDLF